MGIRPAGAACAREDEEHRPKYGNLRREVVEFKTVLHQRADRAFVMLVKIVVMVLRDSQEARDQGQYDYGLEKLHRRVTRLTFLRCG